nr:hypothetical protein [Tanacetum cinerariifolium]
PNKHPLTAADRTQPPASLVLKSSQTNTHLGFLVGGGLWCRGSGGGSRGDERRWWCGVVSVWSGCEGEWRLWWVYGGVGGGVVVMAVGMVTAAAVAG